MLGVQPYLGIEQLLEPCRQAPRTPTTRGGVLPGARSLPCACLFCRLVSGNSIEEKLLKNGTKDLIREVAAQGNDYSMAFLTQVPAGGLQSSWLLRGDGGRGGRRVRMRSCSAVSLGCSLTLRSGAGPFSAGH